MRRTEDEKYEAIGNTVFSVAYLLFALRFILIASAAALGILFLLDKPLWLAPIFGIVAFLIYRAVYRLILRFFIGISRE